SSPHRVSLGRHEAFQSNPSQVKTPLQRTPAKTKHILPLQRTELAVCHIALRGTHTHTTTHTHSVGVLKALVECKVSKLISLVCDHTARGGGGGGGGQEERVGPI